jgi:hypothetical protein
VDVPCVWRVCFDVLDHVPGPVFGVLERRK